MFKVVLKFGIIIVFMFASISLALASSLNLTILMDDYPPWNFQKDGVSTGASVDAVKNIFEDSRIEPKFVTLPWSRVLKTAKNSEVCFITTVKERFYTGEYTLFGFNEPTPDRIILIRLRNHSVGMLRESSTVAGVRDDISVNLVRGKFKIYETSHLSQSIKMLNTKRVDFLVGIESSIVKLIKNKSLDSFSVERVIVPELHGYMACNKSINKVLLSEISKAWASRSHIVNWEVLYKKYSISRDARFY